MAEAKQAARRVGTFLSILRRVGVPIDANTRILDLGCGAGGLVKAGRAQGMQFYGCGIQLEDAFTQADPRLLEQGILRGIPLDPYTLPFEDGFFDVVISDQVFEHVMDYPTTVRESHRVLKPGGSFLHIFPSRSKPIEPHVLVPLASVVRARWWLKTWALLGVRNQFQRRMSAAEAAANNLHYLTSRTNYLPKRELHRQFSEYFSEVRFVEEAFLTASERGRKVYKLFGGSQLLPKLYSALRCRVTYGRRSAA